MKKEKFLPNGWPVINESKKVDAWVSQGVQPVQPVKTDSKSPAVRGSMDNPDPKFKVEPQDM